MAFQRILIVALGAGAASAAMTCPGSSAPLFHTGMEITSTASVSCQEVQSEMEMRVDGQYAYWHDPHNNGTYTAASFGGTASFTRRTGDGKYTDKMIFTLTPEGSQCKIEACSESQVTSGLDFGTNYCNLKMLYCGSADGCKPVKYDFTTSGEVTQKKAEASVDMKACLKVAEKKLMVV